MLSHPSVSLHVMIMSWHRLQHTPSTVSTEDCLSSLHSADYKLTPECRFSFRCASLHNWPWSTSSAWELKATFTVSHSHGCELTNWWIESQHPARHPLTASKYSAKPACLRLPSLHDHGLQVHLQTRSITASMCILKLARLQPPNFHDHSLQVYLQIRSITILACISKFTPSWPLSKSPNRLDDHLQVHLQTRSITAS